MTPGGTAGYADHADRLLAQYEAIPFEHKHRASLHLLPSVPCAVLDIGAGSGSDAAWLAERGFQVTAVEPIAAFRLAAAKLHPHPAIEWVDDSLPSLPSLVARQRQYGLVLATAVWMHLDACERAAAMHSVASLLSAQGLLSLTLRHGPVPAGRRMYEVSAAETGALGKQHGLATILNLQTASAQPANRQAGITWSRLVFQRQGNTDHTASPQTIQPGTCHPFNETNPSTA